MHNLYIYSIRLQFFFFRFVYAYFIIDSEIRVHGFLFPEQKTFSIN